MATAARRGKTQTTNDGLKGRAAARTMVECIAGGVVNAGWSAASWRRELRRKAARCRELHPERAAELEAWAEGITAVEG